MLSLRLILGIALLVRLVWVLLVPVAPHSDPGAYDILARVLLDYGVYGFEADDPSAKWPPGTAAFYALIYALPGPDFAAALAANVLVSLLNVWLAWVVGREFFDDLTGRVAALAMALWPQMIYFTTLLASEPLFILLTLTAVLCWSRGQNLKLGWLIAAGVLFGLACYVRSVGLLLPVALTLGALVVGTASIFQVLGRFAIVAVVIAATIAPWTLRNQQIFGDTIVMSSNFGSTLYMGNGPGTTGRHASAEYPESFKETVKDMTQPERSSFLGDLAKKEILSDPGAFVLRSLDKLRIVHDRETIGVEWNGPGLEQAGVGDAGFTALKIVATLYWWGILLGGLLGLLWQMVYGVGWRFLFSTPSLVWFYFAGIHAVVMASDRFHMPQAPFIAMIAASFLIGRRKQRDTDTTQVAPQSLPAEVSQSG